MRNQIKKHNISYKGTLGHKSLETYGAKKMEENELVQDVEIEITGVKLEMLDDEKIKKVRFSTGKGDITWKPKSVKTSLNGGFEIETSEAMTLSQMPSKLKELAKMCGNTGSVKAKVCYLIFNKDADGEIVSYRYISSAKLFDKWVF